MADAATATALEPVVAGRAAAAKAVAKAAKARAAKQRAAAGRCRKAASGSVPPGRCRTGGWGALWLPPSGERAALVWGCPLGCGAPVVEAGRTRALEALVLHFSLSLAPTRCLTGACKARPRRVA
eukprot:scaffold29775_cov40-Phaeocystis_antarctica.AAC.1